MAGITKLRNFEENQIPNEEKVVKVSMFQRERLKWFHWLETMTERMARMRCKSFLEMPFTAKHFLQLGEETRLVYVSYKSKGRGGKDCNTSSWLESSLLLNGPSPF
jgi:hypothetical protein